MSTPPGLLLLTESSKKKTLLIKNKENIDPNFTYKTL